VAGVARWVVAVSGLWPGVAARLPLLRGFGLEFHESQAKRAAFRQELFRGHRWLGCPDRTGEIRIPLSNSAFGVALNGFVICVRPNAQGLEPWRYG